MKITNTQYLKKGDKTNHGIVTKIYDNKNFQTNKQFSWNVDQHETFKIIKP